MLSSGKRKRTPLKSRRESLKKRIVNREKKEKRTLIRGKG